MSKSCHRSADPHNRRSAEHPSRRDLLLGSAMFVGGLAGGEPGGLRTAAAAPAPASKWDHEYTFGHTRLFMDEYHAGILGILSRIAGEAELVGELTSRAAKVVRSGHDIWTSMNDGHMPTDEQKETRRGSPRIMKDHRDFGPLKKGDMVFTNFCNRQVQAARDRGVYVVCVTTNYQNNEFRPAGFTESSRDNPDRLMLKDVSNEILHSHIPYYQGLVHAPEIPEFAVN